MLNEIDAYGVLKNNIDFALANNNINKTILITSTMSNEGKTTVATKLARNIAAMGKKVILIDGNLRNPSVHNMSGIDNDFGLTEVIEGSKSSEQVIKVEDNLAILTTGKEVQSPTIKLESIEIKNLINDLKSQYEYVIIDSPTANKTADAKILSSYADGVLLVVRTGVTNIESIKTVKKEFERTNINIIGTVLNDYKGI